MLRGLNDKEKKRKSNCKRVMLCNDCDDLRMEFGSETVNDVIAILGLKAAAAEVKAFIAQGGLREGC